MSGSALVLRGDARRLPLSDVSVDLVVTSPPFLNLRSYRDNGVHYEGQVGTGTQERFLEDLWEIMLEVKRVMKPTASAFIELGDSYEKKSLNLSPHRFAIGCVDRLGFILRAEIIWDRPNGLPESVTDRVRRSHSCWFHMVKEPKYFAAVDEVRELHDDNSANRTRKKYGAVPNYGAGKRGDDTGKTRAKVEGRGDGAWGFEMQSINPLGKLPGSVWQIPSEPLLIPQWAKDKYNLPDHFAAFPQEWPRRLILGWSPSGVCEACGEGRRPVVDKQNPRRSAEYKSLPGNPGDAARKSQTPISGGPNSGLSMPGWRKFPKSQTTITGYACACPEENANEMDSLRGTSRTRNPSTSVDRSASDDPLRLIKPAIVLDPFGGTGTVAMVARALGRDAISLDLSMDYSRLAQWRIHTSGHGAKALGRTWRERQGTL